MRVAATADLHGIELPEIEECDLLLIAGDVAPDPPDLFDSVQKSTHVQRKWLREDFAEWLDEVPAEEKVWIAGNHDYVCEEGGFRRTAEQLPAHYLQDTSIELFGYKIHGTPWVPNLPGWAFYADDAFLAAATRIIPEDADIVISHGPPNGYGDQVLRGSHVGNPTLTSWISKNQPELVVCGHIHEDHGRWEMGDTTLINASYVDVRYQPTGKVEYFELENR